MYRLSAVAATLLCAASFASADPVVEERAAITATYVYPQPSQTCVGGVHMIIARASLEQQGEGILGGVASKVQDMVPNSDAVAVVYPATESNYIVSEQEGVYGMKELVTDYVSKCPGHWISLLGYSQGAQVVADTVIGSNNSYFSDSSTNPTGLGTKYLDQISSLILMGDPGYTPDFPGKYGNNVSTKPGFFPRQNVGAFTKYGLADKMRVYCDQGDSVCASGTGSNGIDIHVGYVDEFGSNAASFIASKFTSANGGSVKTSAAGGGSSSQAQTTAAQSSAMPTSAAGGGSQAAGASSAMTTGSAAGGDYAYLTSQRYTPTTSKFTGTFQQVGTPTPTGGANGRNVEKGVAGVVFGGAMFVMGMI